MGYLINGNIIGIGANVALTIEEPGELPYLLPSEATNEEILDYSDLGLTTSETNTLLNDLYSDGFCTNCVIDITGNSIPNAFSEAAIAGLEAAGNIIVKDSI